MLTGLCRPCFPIRIYNSPIVLLRCSERRLPNAASACRRGLSCAVRRGSTRHPLTSQQDLRQARICRRALRVKQQRASAGRMLGRGFLQQVRFSASERVVITLHETLDN
jgi:hypothetical protein